MPRPKRCRWVLSEPGATFFKPRGVPMRVLDQVVLTLDEVEALRLADLEQRYHQDAAASMKVSRQTFGRIVAAARHKVAEALVHGKALVIRHGAGVQRLVGLLCPSCGFRWEVIPEGTTVSCPACGSSIEIDRKGEGR